MGSRRLLFAIGVLASLPTAVLSSPGCAADSFGTTDGGSDAGAEGSSTNDGSTGDVASAGDDGTANDGGDANEAGGGDAAGGCAALRPSTGFCEDFDHPAVSSSLHVAPPPATYVTTSVAVSLPKSLAVDFTTPDGGTNFGAALSGPEKSFLNVDFDLRVMVHAKYVEPVRVSWPYSASSAYDVFLYIDDSGTTTIDFGISVADGSSTPVGFSGGVQATTLYDNAFHHVRLSIDLGTRKASALFDGAVLVAPTLPVPAGTFNGTTEATFGFYASNAGASSWSLAYDNLVVDPW